MKLKQGLALQNYTQDIDEEHARILQLLNSDISILKTRLENLEMPTDNFKPRPKRDTKKIRKKHALFRFGSDIMKYLRGAFQK